MRDAPAGRADTLDLPMIDAPPGPVDARRAALVTGVALLAVYALTLAPGVTFWDAGEFLAAADALGIPHPPGTPLFVLLLNVWTRALGLVGVPVAVAGNLMSAACTAAAAAISAALAARWAASTAAGVAVGLAIGGMATIWLNATETEVYAPTLLLAVATLWCADRRGAGGDARWLVATAYALALAVPLHLSALVVAPAAIALLARDDRGAWHRGDAIALGGVALLVAGAGLLRPVLAGAGLLLVAHVSRTREGRRVAGALLAAVAIATTGVLFLLVRAAHDPAVNQGGPSTLESLLQVLGRRQYAVAGFWPRQAPVWLQLANILEYADWQVALSLAPGPVPSPARLAATLAWAALAVVGARAHRVTHPRSWLAVLVMLVAGSIGVAAQLNLKAGPTIGIGILPDDAPHEARERDYFFVLAWWAWALWAGLGVAALARRHGRAVLACAALPLLLNARAVNRRDAAVAALPTQVAEALLASAPAGAVLVVNGDNDSYPLWYAQQARAVRRDVTVVTIPLLGARWYRAELARRAGLVDSAAVARWFGEAATLQHIGDRAAAAGRPVAVAASVPAAERAALGDGWRLRALAYVRDTAAAGVSVDSTASAGVARALRDVGNPPEGARGGIAPRREPATRWARALLRCPGWAAVAHRDAYAAAQLDSVCNRR